MSDPAAPRFFAIQIARLIGAALVVAGLLTSDGRLTILPHDAAYAMIVVGLVCFVLLPFYLARRWRSPPE